MARPLGEIDYPQTADEWWLVVTANAFSLRELTAGYHPDTYRIQRHPVTAEAAEALCEKYRDEIRAASNRDALAHPAERFDAYLAARDPAMLGLLNDVWIGLPESYGVRGLAGFGVLCDLCSEGGVLYPEEE